MILTLSVLYAVWTAYAVAFIWHHLGDKRRKDTWVDWVIVAPALPILYLIGVVLYVADRFNGRNTR